MAKKARAGLSAVIALTGILAVACTTTAILPAGLFSPDHGVLCGRMREACFDRFGPSIGLTAIFLGKGAADALTATLRKSPPESMSGTDFSLGANIACRRETGPCRTGGIVDETLTAVLYDPRPAGTGGTKMSGYRHRLAVDCQPLQQWQRSAAGRARTLPVTAGAGRIIASARGLQPGRRALSPRWKHARNRCLVFDQGRLRAGIAGDGISARPGRRGNILRQAGQVVPGPQKRHRHDGIPPVMSGLRRETGEEDGLKTNIRAVTGLIYCRCRPRCCSRLS